MRTRTIAGGTLAATLLIAVGAGCPTALADVPYADLLVNPNTVTDSTAYAPDNPPVVNPATGPDGASNNGISQSFSHRDGTRRITDTILVFPDSAAAVAALPTESLVSGGTQKPANVGNGGTLFTGTTSDASHSLTVLRFTEGNALVNLTFEGNHNDPVPPDLAIEMGQAQANLIKDRLPI